MNTFLGYPIKQIIKNETFDIIKDQFDIHNLLSSLYHSYVKNIPYIITNKNISIQKDKPGVYYIGDKLDLYFTWDYIIKLNKFFGKKYTVKEDFMVDDVNYNIIFFLEFINKHSSLLKDTGINLLGNVNSFFGIISNRNHIVHGCKHLIFFSNKSAYLI